MLLAVDLFVLRLRFNQTLIGEFKTIYRPTVKTSHNRTVLFLFIVELIIAKRSYKVNAISNI